MAPNIITSLAITLKQRKKIGDSISFDWNETYEFEFCFQFVIKKIGC